jgi:helitron helicase-like protein
MFIYNPTWCEMQNELLLGQTTSDRLDLTVCIFNIYKTKLVDELAKHGILSASQGHVYTIEFQKYGLPHIHLLLSLLPHFQPTTAANIDSIIHTTWPDPDCEPVLFNIVKCCMVHGPCGTTKPDAPCMKDSKCTKEYPKKFHMETIMNHDGYLIYARPDNGHAYEVCHFMADNRWIISYNPHILS